MSSTSSSTRRTIVSAPGKVLMAGGYLVLDRLYTGLVVATSSRFFCSVSSSSSQDTTIESGSSTSSGNQTTSPNHTATITVRAGQFPSSSSTWSYAVILDDGPKARLRLVQTNENAVGRNKFVEITLSKTLELAWESISMRGATDLTKTSNHLDEAQSRDGAIDLLIRLRGSSEGLEIVVLGDNDFYSQREQLAAASLPPLISSLNTLQPFCPLPRSLAQTNKTGLGSSAALVTSLIGGLLSHLDIVSLSPSQGQSTDLDLVHALAQLAHCLAQGKVGSGFDVSSAVYGSHVYRRFSPSILTPLMSSSSEDPTDIPRTGCLLSSLSSDKWDQETIPFRLPKGIRMMLADVDAGTDTPSFVGKVLAWRKQSADDALRIWTQLSEANEGLREALEELVAAEGKEGYAEVLDAAGRIPIWMCENSNLVGQLLLKTRNAIDQIRRLLREMSDASEVPIEPPAQSRLLDACSECPGVIGGGVPGAGGFDAIYLLVIDTPDDVAVQAVEKVWAGWTEMSVCPLSARQSDGGLCLEEIENVEGLKEALSRQ